MHKTDDDTYKLYSISQYFTWSFAIMCRKCSEAIKGCQVGVALFTFITVTLRAGEEGIVS